MPITTAVAIFFLIWWVVLFAVLPWGVRSQHEGGEITPGTDPGAPAIGLQVRDIDAAIAAMKAAGGSSITQGGSVKLGSGKVGFVRDPNGLLVELAQN